MTTQSQKLLKQEYLEKQKLLEPESLPKPEPLEQILSVHNIYITKMKDLKQLLIDKIKENRPKLGASSIKTYVSILMNLHKNMKEETHSLDWFSSDHENILKYLEDKNAQTRKTSLSAIYGLTGRDEYRVVMMQVMQSVNNLLKEQKKTPTEAENWISEDEVKSVYNNLLQKATAMLTKKAIFNDGHFIQFLLVAFLSGAVMPPRRSLDFGEMMIRNYDPKTDNFYKAGKFYFNKYKTSSTYGLQTLDVPKPLNLMIKRWLKLNQTDYMLYSTNKQKLSSPQINRILNTAFGGKKISTNMLRHIYLSSVYAGIPALSSIDRLATQMGHSPTQAMEYIKH